MKNRFFKIAISALLIAVMALPLFSCGSKNQTASGTWGDFSWNLSKEGTLYVSGSGKLPTVSSSKDVGWASVRESVKRISFDGKVTAFSDYAFYGMSNLTAITIPSDAEVTSIGKATFAFCTSIKNYAIPATVTSIGESAFEGCTALKQIKIPAGVTSIGSRAFMYCRSLTSFIAMGDDISSIGKWTFNDCRSLETVALHETIDKAKISENAFEKAKISKNDIIYTDAVDGKVTITVKFVDENGKNVISNGKEYLPDVHENAVLGETYKYKAKTFDGYTLTSDETVSVTALTNLIEDKDEIIKFVYKKTSLTDTPTTDKPEADTPATDTSTESDTASDSSTPAQTDKTDNSNTANKDENKNSSTTIIALVIFGVVIVGICVGAFLLIRADKKHKKNGTTVRKNVDDKNKKGKNTKKGKRK